VRDAVRGFKYEQRFELARMFATMLAKEAASMGTYDVAMPVPLHRLRLRKRGYNQAVLLSRPLARIMKIDHDTCALVRAREVGPQVDRELAERLVAVKGIFAVRHPERVRGKRVLLIDDVLTTGATVNECARILKKAGASRVDVLTIARVL